MWTIRSATRAKVTGITWGLPSGRVVARWATGEPSSLARASARSIPTVELRFQRGPDHVGPPAVPGGADMEQVRGPQRPIQVPHLWLVGVLFDHMGTMAGGNPAVYVVEAGGA